MEAIKWTERERAPGDLCKHSQKQHLLGRGDQKIEGPVPPALGNSASEKVQAAEGTQMSSCTGTEGISLESFLIILLPKLQHSIDTSESIKQDVCVYVLGGGGGGKKTPSESLVTTTLCAQPRQQGILESGCTCPIGTWEDFTHCTENLKACDHWGRGGCRGVATGSHVPTYPSGRDPIVTWTEGGVESFPSSLLKPGCQHGCADRGVLGIFKR